MGKGVRGAVPLLAASSSLSQSREGLHDFPVMLSLWPFPRCTLGICISQKVMPLVITQKSVPWL